MKTVIILHKKELTDKYLKIIQRTLYDKIIIIVLKSSYSEKSILKKNRIEVIECKSKNCISKIIDDVFIKYSNYKILPYFEGDCNSRYSIKVYNKTFETSINPHIFKLKNKMNEFLKEYTNKNNLKLKFSDLKQKSYKELEKEFGPHFILKPLNAASSLLNFKIIDELSYEKALKKLQSKYQYIIEEYISGNLYATDLFFDGSKIFVMCHSREITFSEILNKFSDSYLIKYKNLLTENFMHFLPVRYTLETSKIPKIAQDFIKNICKKLKSIKYRGFLHLEYKYDKEAKKVGFIEWGARNGGNRNYFIRKMHNVTCEQIPYEVLCKKNYNHFVFKDGIYYLANKDHEKNYVGIKTNPLEKTHLMDLLKKNPNFMNYSFEDFLKRQFWDIGKIEFNKIDFNIKTTSDYYLYPFYQRSDTKFDYIIEFDEENFKKFLSKKYTIIEKLVFHDY